MLKQYVTISALLREYRQTAGLTQAALAERLNLSLRHYRRLEDSAAPERARIKPGLLSDLAAATGIPYLVWLNVAGENPIWYDCHTGHYAFSDVERDMLDLTFLRQYLRDGQARPPDPSLRLISLHAIPWSEDLLATMLAHDPAFQPHIGRLPRKCLRRAAALCPELNVLIRQHDGYAGHCVILPVTAAFARQLCEGERAFTALTMADLISGRTDLPQASLLLSTIFMAHPQIIGRFFAHIYPFLMQQAWSPAAQFIIPTLTGDDVTICEQLGLQRQPAALTPADLVGTNGHAGLHAIRLAAFLAEFAAA